MAPSETGGRGQGLGFTAPAQPKSSERTSQEDLMEPSEQVSRSDGTIGGGEAPKKCDPTTYRLPIAGRLQVAVQKISQPSQLIFARRGENLGKDTTNRAHQRNGVKFALAVFGAQSSLPSRCCRATRPPVSSGEREGEGLRARLRLRVMARAARAPAARERTACCSSAASVRSARASTRQRRARAWWGTASSTWLGAGAGLGVGLGLGLGSGI